MVSGTIVPSQLRGPRSGPVRDGASRAHSRISRNTRRSEVRIPFSRGRALTFRCPSSWNGLAARTGGRGGEPRIRQRSGRAATLPVGLQGALAADARLGIIGLRKWLEQWRF
jgi:hypothetical protein